MTVDEVLKYYGTADRVAKALGYTRCCINNWKVKGRVSLVAQLKLEKITRGKLKFDVKDLGLDQS